MAVTVEIRGKKFPLCLTVAALDQLNEKCGGIGGIMDFLRGNPEEIQGLNDAQLQQLSMEATSRAKYNNAWMLGLLIRDSGVQVVYGPQVSVIKSELEDYMKNA
jgi:hypothetical protein